MNWDAVAASADVIGVVLSPYFTVHDEFNERIAREGEAFPSFTDMVPFFRPGPEQLAKRGSSPGGTEAT